GFYTNGVAGPAYATYLVEELIPTIERNFPARPAREARCIGGLSMGGYGALRLGLGYPDRFASITSHSGALQIGQTRRSEYDGNLSDTEFASIFGDDPTGSDHDLAHLASRLIKSGQPRPRIRIDCGT